MAQGTPASPAACPLLAAPALTCSLCALWSLWWVWVSGPLLPQKRLKKQMKQNYREWMETYLKGKPETQLEMLFLGAGMWAKLRFFCRMLQSGGDSSWRRRSCSSRSGGLVGYLHGASSALLAHSHLPTATAGSCIHMSQ